MSDSNVYTAERIISKEVRNGVTLYLIKWKGYSSRDNTWEPLENIIDHNLLDEYERKHQAKKTKRSSTTSSTRSRSVAAAKDSDDRENSINNPPATTSRATPPISPRFDQSSVAASPSNLNATKSPIVDSKSSNSTSTSPSVKTSSTIVGVSSKTPTPPPPPSTTPQIQKQAVVSPNNSKLSNFSTKSTEVQAGPLDSPQDKKLLNSKIAIMNTVITDVTVHDQTITICESKTHQGFFKEFLAPSQA